ncbi:MAG: hypothetical protein ACKODK_00460, partial [Opitutaceae bacterium]
MLMLMLGQRVGRGCVRGCVQGWVRGCVQGWVRGGIQGWDFALSASGSGLQGSFTGTDITLVDVWAPLPPGGSAFYRIYAK